jgi:hypothetical protein
MKTESREHLGTTPFSGSFAQNRQIPAIERTIKNRNSDCAFFALHLFFQTNQKYYQLLE